MPRQLGLLLAGVAGTFAMFAVMPGPLALGIALVLGGAALAPALTLENTLVGRIAPDGMLNEAYTWVVTVSVAASAFGGAVAIAAVVAVVAAWPAGPLARAEATATVRMAVRQRRLPVAARSAKGGPYLVGHRRRIVQHVQVAPG